MLNSVYQKKKSSDFGEGTGINAPSLKLVYINLFICSEAVACRLLELFFFLQLATLSHSFHYICSFSLIAVIDQMEIQKHIFLFLRCFFPLLVNLNTALTSARTVFKGLFFFNSRKKGVQTKEPVVLIFFFFKLRLSSYPCDCICRVNVFSHSYGRGHRSAVILIPLTEVYM